MGPEVIMFSFAFAMNPNQIDPNHLVRYMDQQTNAGQHLERYAKKHIPTKVLEYGGMVGFVTDLAVRRQVAFRMEF
jgi:hypothetical protein